MSIVRFFVECLGFLEQAYKNRNRGVHRTTFHESEVVRVNELEFEQKLSEAASNGKCNELMGYFLQSHRPVFR